ncbi:hypothetical protein STEG23_003094, partial [Scotinomys teguina]
IGCGLTDRTGAGLSPVGGAPAGPGGAKARELVRVRERRGFLRSRRRERERFSREVMVVGLTGGSRVSCLKKTEKTLVRVYGANRKMDRVAPEKKHQDPLMAVLLKLGVLGRTTLSQGSDPAYKIFT